MDYATRCERLQAAMRAAGIDAVLIAQNVDLYYFTGSMQTGYLLLPAVGRGSFYVRRSLVRAQQEATAAVAVTPLGSLRAFGERLALDYPAVFGKDGPVLAAEFDVLPVLLFQRLQGLVPRAQWVDGSRLIRELRMIKSERELDLIREAARVVDLAFESAVARLQVGMTELELVTAIEQEVRRHGHLGLMRMRGFNQETVTGMVGAGAAIAEPTYFDGPAGGLGLSAASPQSASRSAIQRNEPILIDIGCCIDGYVIDQTRTAVIGELSDDLQQAYLASERIIRATELQLKPGTICSDLYRRSVAAAEDEGLAAHFMGYGQDQVKFLGHGIGLEVDELPVLAAGFDYPLQAGMVIAIEPKFTFPGRGVVGIENCYLITDDHYEQLTVTREGIIQL